MNREMHMSRVPLSVAIITQDEAGNLPGCLVSVAFADEIVVVDSGSADKTVEIAEAAGCTVFREPWRGGFGAQKQFAIDQCRHPWVLVLDADERVPPETALVIRKIIQDPSPDGAAGFSFPRKNFFQGRWIRHAGWWPDRVVRLFRRDLGFMSQAPVHESVEVSGPTTALQAPLEHMTESDLSRILLKIDRYSTLGAREAFAAGRKTSVVSALFRSLITFTQDYFLRLGFLDGAQGLTLAVTDSVNKFFKYAKLADLNRRARRD
jgi:glycosyltransferase involved in cell wall biosynthesis